MTTVPAIEPRDEFRHQPEGSSTSPWKDTWWFVCRDTERDATIELHLTVSPHGAPARCAWYVTQGRKVVTGVYRGELIEDDAAFGTPEIRLHVLEPAWDTRKHIRITGDVDGATFEIDVRGRFVAGDFTTLAPGFLPRDSEATEFADMRNMCQAMTFSGQLSVGDGSPLLISGPAFRDRSWGWRKSGALFRFGWSSVFAATDEMAALAVIFFGSDVRQGSGSRAAGWVVDKSELRPAQHLDFHLDATGRPSAMTVTDDRDRTFTVSTTDHDLTTFLPFHDADSAGNELVVPMFVHHANVMDPRGQRGWAMNNGAAPAWTSPSQGAQLFSQHQNHRQSTS